MISVYTNLPENDKDYVKYNDVFFDANTIGMKFSQKSLDAMKNIDNAVMIEGRKIKTPFGYGNLWNLSTGCKTVINILENPDLLFYTDECGTNAIEELFKHDNIKLLRTYGCTPKVRDDQEFCFNDTDVVRGQKGFALWWTKIGGMR